MQVAGSSRWQDHCVFSDKLERTPPANVSRWHHTDTYNCQVRSQASVAPAGTVQYSHLAGTNTIHVITVQHGHFNTSGAFSKCNHPAPDGVLAQTTQGHIRLQLNIAQDVTVQTSLFKVIRERKLLDVHQRDHPSSFCHGLSLCISHSTACH